MFHILLIRDNLFLSLVNFFDRRYEQLAPRVHHCSARFKAGKLVTLPTRGLGLMRISDIAAEEGDFAAATAQKVVEGDRKPVVSFQ